ncbi:helix-turn-helix domain-containing protein [Halorubellus sp. PRR65]|uniref:helix-turn-helix domain-containing protein n=1 Tax=Halorubellus sp. PRR65 TaxID=3098148 RepID=UPI002B263FAB|nr:helix-turn-helix domain-containing protein [Halorubellus sp. PRR65]
MFSKSQFRVLSNLIQNAKQEVPISTLASQLDWSQSHTSRVVDALETNGHLHTTKRGRKKRVTIADTEPIEDLKPLLTEYAHIDFADHVTGGALEILYYLNQPRTATELADRTTISRATVYRRLNDLQSVGIVNKTNSQYALNDDFTSLSSIARSLAHHEHRREAERHTTGVNIIWETHAEYLLACDTHIEDATFHLTGTHRFEDYGIPLIPQSRTHYFHSEQPTAVTPEDLVCHTLLVDDGPRSQTYCLLLLAHKSLDHHVLHDRAAHYEPEATLPLTNTIDNLLAYLETQGADTTPQLPAWTDFKSTAADYGIHL